MQEDKQHVHRVSSDCSDEDYSNTVGYISMKDYAYDESHVLHSGYFQHINSNNNGMPPNNPDFNIYNEHYMYNYYNHNDHGDEIEGGYNNRTEVDEDEVTDEKRQSIILPNEYVVNRKAIALYDFVPENDNELMLKEGDVVYISYKHAQGWLVAENYMKTRTGLVPEEYVSIFEDYEESEADDRVGDQYESGQARPHYLTHMITESLTAAAKQSSQKISEDSEWEDIDEEEEQEASSEGQNDIRMGLIDIESSMKDKLTLS
ncbi:HBR091Cp [Eremothecium sinecaudum]|uniref:HBR091Cp n=1 Tax=Eremothecium sinecaudum TaxID=45286 RepID=A0A120K145_9SACH|nr:HBR091Cp [Eremothecium sinecaudum]AMD18992.1 HBR091Cp [Eremothecium sinecaudum]